MSTREDIYARLAVEVAKQHPSERLRTMTSSGLPHYRVPHSMASEPMACCFVGQPCVVHAQYVKETRRG